MPKEKKKERLVGNSSRHAPLGQVIQDHANQGKFATVRSEPRGIQKEETLTNEDFLDEKASRKILQLSREQQLEMELEEQKEKVWAKKSEKTRSHGGEMGENNADSTDEEEETSSIFIDEEMDEDDLVRHDSGYVTVAQGNSGLSTEEEKIVAAMMGGQKEERRTLADIILEKIQEKEMQQQGCVGDEEDESNIVHELPPKVVEVYTDIGKILSRYSAGKLPKAFKVIPGLSNWEEVLYLTRPDQWSPQAMYAATRIFASNLNPKMAQRFYNLVLLDSVRADIFDNHRLNYHYYMALKKAVYKPAAFFKGILLPLCKDKNCTLREAAIVASVLQRVSIPVHHSAVAIHKLAQLEYCGAASLFIKTLLNKKYSLPSPVIATLVKHFSCFLGKNDVLPVLWHQCLLVFVQRYKNEVQDEARESLRLLMKKHFHHKITPEIRRELFGAQAWKEERALMLDDAPNMET